MVQKGEPLFLLIIEVLLIIRKNEFLKVNVYNILFSMVYVCDFSAGGPYCNDCSAKVNITIASVANPTPGYNKCCVKYRYRTRWCTWSQQRIPAACVIPPILLDFRLVCNAILEAQYLVTLEMKIWKTRFRN